MAETLREKIIKAYVTRLAGILTASGYNINAGASVYRAQITINPDDLPAIVVWPKPEESKENYNSNFCDMALRCEVMAAFGSTNASIVQEQMLGDLKKCMLISSTPITYVDEISYVSGGPTEQPPGEDTVTAIFGEFRIIYHETIGDPYSQ